MVFLIRLVIQGGFQSWHVTISRGTKLRKKISIVSLKSSTFLLTSRLRHSFFHSKLLITFTLVKRIGFSFFPSVENRSFRWGIELRFRGNCRKGKILLRAQWTFHGICTIYGNTEKKNLVTGISNFPWLLAMTNSNMQNSMAVSAFSVLDWKYTFWANLAPKFKILYLKWNLVPRLIWICKIQWWYSLFLFLMGNTLFG